jgi:hypothetical protein
MTHDSLRGLLIRTAEVRRPDLGFILAADPELESQGVEHTVAFRWKAGVLHEGRAKFSAHSCAIVDEPEYAVVKISASGIYSIETRAGVTTGNVFRDSAPARRDQRFGDIRSVKTVKRKAFVVGFEGTVYRLDRLDGWTRIDDGLPSQFDIEAIDGFSLTDVYAVGFQGEVWHFNGEGWERRDVPTDTVLTSVKCADDGFIYIGGHKGILLRGRADVWEVVDDGAPQDDIWDLEWFAGALYASTMTGVYRCLDRRCEPVEFSGDPPATTYQLSASEGVMWSVGRRDIVAFDGVQWRRII